MDAIEVTHKPTGEKRWIKSDRFNPEFHERILDSEVISESLSQEEATVDVKPSSNDDSLESLTMSKVRGMAKEKGIKFLPSTKKVELIALIRAST